MPRIRLDGQQGKQSINQPNRLIVIRHLFFFDSYALLNNLQRYSRYFCPFVQNNAISDPAKRKQKAKTTVSFCSVRFIKESVKESESERKYPFTVLFRIQWSL
jgi:hypothetical protein